MDNLESNLEIKIEHINTLAEHRIIAQERINDDTLEDIDKVFASYVISFMTSCSSSDIYEPQISKLFGITNINTKHGWDGNDSEKDEPYEYKPTKIDPTKNYFKAKVNISDDSVYKINNEKNKEGYNNDNANFVIAIIDKDTSEFICIYKFKERILKEDRIKKVEESKEKNIINNKTTPCNYSTSIEKCIEFSEQHNEKYYSWKNEKYL